MGERVVVRYADFIASARATIRSMLVGAVETFPLPKEQPERRILYQTIAASALKCWGGGCYRMRQTADGLVLYRCDRFPSVESLNALPGIRRFGREPGIDQAQRKVEAAWWSRP